MNKLEQAQITMSGVRRDVSILLSSARNVSLRVNELLDEDNTCIHIGKGLATLNSILEENIAKCEHYFEEVGHGT